MRALALAVVVVALSGCGGYKTDLETICNARARAKVPAGADAAAKDDALGAYLLLNVHTPRAKRLYARFGSASLVEKARVLRGEAAKEGLASCALADEFDPPTK